MASEQPAEEDRDGSPATRSPSPSLESGDVRKRPSEDDDATYPRKKSGRSADVKYPRKRSSKACILCRKRKVKCDNAVPSCSFCLSIGTDCIYDGTLQADNSSFDPATQAILRKLTEVIDSQKELIKLIRDVREGQSAPTLSEKSREQSGTGMSTTDFVMNLMTRRTGSQPSRTFDPIAEHRIQRNLSIVPSFTDRSPRTPFEPSDLPDHYAAEAGSSVTSHSGNSAAVRWFGLVANDAPNALQDGTSEAMFQGSPRSSWNRPNPTTTPLQQATQMIDRNQNSSLSEPRTPASHDDGGVDSRTTEPQLWQARGDIRLIPHEQSLFQNFIQRVSPWLDHFDPRNTFASLVPRLALRNAGLMNALLALSCQYLILHPESLMDRPDPTTALQYYNQTLHYIQKAMQYSSYQSSSELVATTILVSMYEMLGSSEQDWERHLQGVFWILRSKQINVEVDGLESAAWWAWLRQDVWVAFCEKRKPYTTWSPTKPLASLTPHELALRAIWILAQVVGFCSLSLDPNDTEQSQLMARLQRSTELSSMLDDWYKHLTPEFQPFPSPACQGSTIFQPLLIHPPCFALATQLHYVAKILLHFNKPSLSGIQEYTQRSKAAEPWIHVVCGLGLTLIDEASSVISSQCLFIAGLFTQDQRERECIVNMLDACRTRTGWPQRSLESDLRQAWSKTDRSGQ